MRKTRAILIYYFQIFPATLICTYLVCIPIQAYGWAAFVYMFWVKIITTLLALYFNNVFRIDETYFYYNIGIKKWNLRVIVLGIDTLLFVLALMIFFRPK